MLNWLADNVPTFKIQHDAHREFHLDVQQHLAHRARIGNAPIFLNAADEDACVAADTLWELRVILPDDSVFDIAGSNLKKCIRVVSDLNARRKTAIAA